MLSKDEYELLSDDMKRLVTQVVGMVGWLEDGSTVDLEESIQKDSVEKLNERIKQCKEDVITLQDIVHGLNYELGMIDALRWKDIR